MLNLNHFHSYFQERFQIIPWGILSLIIAVFSFGRWEYLSFSLTCLTILSLMSYRLNDDIMCMSIDKAHGKKRNFHNHITSLSKWSVVMMILTMIVGAIFLHLHAFLVLAGFTVINSVLYHFLKKSVFIEFISILKYPVIIGVIEYTQKGILSYWSFAFFLVFLLTEIYEHKSSHKETAQKIQMLGIVMILTVRIGIAYI